MTWAAVAIGGAAVIGGVASSAIGSSAQASAAGKATDNQNQAAQLGRLNRLVTMLGPEKGLATWKTLTPKNWVTRILGTPATSGNSADAQRQLAALDQQITDLKKKPSGKIISPADTKAKQQQIAALQQQRDSIAKGSGAQPGLLSEADIAKLGPGLQEDYNALGDKAAAQNKSNLSGYDADTAGLTQDSKDIEAKAKNFGVKELANLKENTDLEQQSLDRKSLATLSSRGIGAGSAATDALAANSDQSRRQYNAAAAGIEDKQIGLQTQLATGSLGLKASRLGGRNSLLVGGQQNEQGLRVGALNTKQSALSGDTPYYANANSPTAAALMTAGSGLTGAASPLAGYAFRNWMNSGSGTGNTGGVDSSLSTLGSQGAAEGAMASGNAAVYDF